MDGSTIAKIIDTARPYLTEYGVWVVGLALFSETFLLTGIWFPGFTLLVAAGYFAAGGEMPVFATLACAWIGAVAGDQGSYLLGRRWGERLLRGKEAHVRRLGAALRDEGRWLLVSYHYATVLRAVVPCVAGTTRYPFRTWIAYDTVGAVLWTTVVFTIGFATRTALMNRGNVALWALDGVAILIPVLIIWRVARRLRSLEPEEEEVEPVADSEPARRAA